MNINVCTLCSGYDSQMMALRRIKDLNANLVYWSDIDDNAIKAHNLIFPEYKDRNLGDITQIDWSDKDDFDLLTYSTPCTTLSCAGLKTGMKKDSNTESSIIWAVEDCIKIKRPKYLVMENVKNMIGSKFKKDFEHWCDVLSSYGYKNFYSVLNARNFNVPQNRERVYMVSVLTDDENYQYTFPKPYDKLERTIDDVLESNLDGKAYLNKDLKLPFEPSSKFVTGALRTRAVGEWYSTPHFQNFEVRSTTYTNTVTSVTKDNVIYETDLDKYRYLTERECFRLMDVDEESIDKILNDKTIKHKQRLAGNSIVVNVLTEIFRQLIKEID